MSDEELFRSAGLILTDEFSQREGITIAAILLFGKDSTTMSVFPQHKTDAIFRIVNTDRYDDRDVVITNLIESYDRLMASYWYANCFVLIGNHDLETESSLPSSYHYHRISIFTEKVSHDLQLFPP